MFVLSVASGVALLAFVLIISLLFASAENSLFRLNGARTPARPLFSRLTAGDGSCPPPASLYASCLCLLLIFLFIPMGALPQYVQTKGDIFIVIFLLLAAQSLYIRGMKNFSGELYQSLDRSEIYLLFKFAVAITVFGAALSWYALKRGVPGEIFSFGTYAAIPLWRISGGCGRLGLLMFFLLFAVTSPCRRVGSGNVKDRLPLPEIFDAIRSTICPALISAIFIPWRAGLAVGLSGAVMYAADFALFWLKVFLMQLLIVPILRSIYLKIKSHLTVRFKLIIVILLGAAGSLLMMADLYL